MIVDKIENISKYKINDNFDKAIHFIENLDFSNLRNEKFNISNEVFAFVQEYELINEKNMMIEMHKKYADIHIILDGAEKIGFNLVENLDEKQAYNSQDDYALYSGDVEYITVQKGMFAIYLPNEPHAPRVSCGMDKVRKLMIKFKV